jgi:atypical dual specificity phosphatase
MALAAQRRQLLDKTCMTPLPPSPLLVGGATAASAFDLMRKLGVKCVLNVTTDLVEPHCTELGSDIEWHRIPLHDSEDQSITEALDESLRLIDRAEAAGGKTLIHCHEGRSRSVTLCLAYLITRNHMPLEDALNFIKSSRPEAQPNTGFMKQLMTLEMSTLGAQSMQLKDLKKGKPKCLSCEICGQVVGLQSALASHMKLKHGTDVATVASMGARSVIEKELTELLHRVNPSKVGNIPHLLEKYAGKEHELYAQVTAKYADSAR